MIGMLDVGAEVKDLTKAQLEACIKELLSGCKNPRPFAVYLEHIYGELMIAQGYLASLKELPRGSRYHQMMAADALQLVQFAASEMGILKIYFESAKPDLPADGGNSR